MDLSRLGDTLAAVAQEIECSPERPPKTSAMRVREATWGAGWLSIAPEPSRRGTHSRV